MSAKPNLFLRQERMVIIFRAMLFAVIIFLSETTVMAASPLRIVAIGASNTQGWYVGNQGAYPAKLQALLKAKGIDHKSSMPACHSTPPQVC
jgi:type IV secretory pathway protease TraF